MTPEEYEIFHSMCTIDDDCECLELHACDRCGQEFESKNALDGHEAEGCWAA